MLVGMHHVFVILKQERIQMRTEWTMDDLKEAAGTMVAQKTQNGYRTPMLIGYVSLSDGQYWGLIDLHDGAFIRYQSIEDLLKILNVGGYVVVNKIFCRYDALTDKIENRHSLPTVLITNVTGRD